MVYIESRLIARGHYFSSRRPSPDQTQTYSRVRAALRCSYSPPLCQRMFFIISRTPLRCLVLNGLVYSPQQPEDKCRNMKGGPTCGAAPAKHHRFTCREGADSHPQPSPAPHTTTTNDFQPGFPPSKQFLWCVAPVTVINLLHQKPAHDIRTRGNESGAVSCP